MSQWRVTVNKDKYGTEVELWYGKERQGTRSSHTCPDSAKKYAKELLESAQNGGYATPAEYAAECAAEIEDDE